MTHRLGRRLERLETRRQHGSIVAMARTIGHRVGIDPAELVAEAEAIARECQRLGLTGIDAMVAHVAAQAGMASEVLRDEMDALGELVP